MTTVNRYDRVPIRATYSEDGYLEDSPVLTRSGVFIYKDGKGGIRRELRRDEDVFHADSLASYRNKPITKGHPGKVNADNVKSHQIGTVTTPGRQDGANVVADTVIHDPRVIKQDGWKELSVGYSVELIETPGEHNGEKYDAIQTNIRVNHLAVVPKGRAGNARLTLDAADAVTKTDDEEDSPTMTLVKVRLDSGLEYEAAPEVEQALKTSRADADKAKVEADKQTARADAAEADKKKLEEGAEKIKQDARTEALSRVKLEAQAKTHKVEVKQDMDDNAIRSAVIKAIRGDADLTDKSDAYIEAAYDIAIADTSKRSDAAAEQRKATTQTKQDEAPQGAKSARQKYLDRLNGIKE